MWSSPASVQRSLAEQRNSTHSGFMPFRTLLLKSCMTCQAPVLEQQPLSRKANCSSCEVTQPKFSITTSAFVGNWPTPLLDGGLSEGLAGKSRNWLMEWEQLWMAQAEIKKCIQNVFNHVTLKLLYSVMAIYTSPSAQIWFCPHFSNTEWKWHFKTEHMAASTRLHCSSDYFLPVSLV